MNPWNVRALSIVNRLSRFRAYFVNTWGDPALYSVFKVLVVAACLSFLSPFVLFLVLRSLRFSLFLMYTLYGISFNLYNFGVMQKSKIGA